MALKIQEESAARDRKTVPLWQREFTLFGGGVGPDERMFFTEQLKMLVENGISLGDAIDMMQSQTDNAALAQLLLDIKKVIESGKSFSYALAQHSSVFDQTYVNMVRASEQGGFLHEVLGELLDVEMARQELRAIISSAMFYPIFLMVFSVFVVIFLLVSIFPKFEDLFGSIWDQLPASTRIFITMSHALTDYWPIILAATVGVIFLLYRMFKLPAVIAFIDALKLRTPFLKTLFLQLYVAQLSRVMAMSLKSGVSVPDALVSCRQAVPNAEIQSLVKNVEYSVNAGQGLAYGFNANALFPDLAKQMINTGEISGNLANVFGSIALYYDRRAKKSIERVSKAVEPLMLVFMGVVIGLLVTSLILPIFKLSTVVQ